MSEYDTSRWFRNFRVFNCCGYYGKIHTEAHMNRYHPVRKMIEEGLTYQAIGDVMGLSKARIMQMAQRMGIARRGVQR